jgi:hypothetical protein
LFAGRFLAVAIVIMTKYFSKKQWKSLPREKKLQWWKVTDFGQKEPSREVLSLFMEYLGSRHLRHRATGDGAQPDA